MMLAAAVTGSSAFGAPPRSVHASGSGATSDISAPHLPDPHQELRHLSKNLNLKRDQRAGVGFILEERSREIQLLFDIDTVSQEYRTTLAAKVIEDSNAEIETLLRKKQRRKFDKELAKTPGII